MKKIARYAVAILVVCVFAAIIAVATSPKSPIIKKISNISELKPPIFPKPTVIENAQLPPEISALSAVAIDAKTGAILYQKEPTRHLLPASTTKLMTALVALENCTSDQHITINMVDKEPNQMGLATGDVITVESAIYGMLINSGNDAAYALSYSCAKSTEEFIKLMNQKAANLNMKNTNFANPQGYDDPQEFSTAEDLAQLARVAVANPLIAKVVATKSTVVTDVSGNKTYYLENVNKLLGIVDGIEGIKTGETPGSLQVLITKTTRNNNTVVTVVLGSQNRFLDSKSLIEWVYANHQWQAQN
ncbi:MAG TPA: D-alanyl-D-alanine carboxypeptidase [Candidatus Saccharimonadales bacterium]|nr:D-alanyl-D-alanine carboxypeptidase [Candidatus Saccharimonadales bacterium]